MTLGYTRNDVVLGLKGQRSVLVVRVRVNDYYMYAYVNAHLTTVIRRGFELYECLLV